MCVAYLAGRRTLQSTFPITGRCSKVARCPGRSSPGGPTSRARVIDDLPTAARVTPCASSSPGRGTGARVHPSARPRPRRTPSMMPAPASRDTRACGRSLAGELPSLPPIASGAACAGRRPAVRYLVVGNGGREHALVWGLQRSRERLRGVRRGQGTRASPSRRCVPGRSARPVRGRPARRRPRGRRGGGRGRPAVGERCCRRRPRPRDPRVRSRLRRRAPRRVQDMDEGAARGGGRADGALRVVRRRTIRGSRFSTPSLRRTW